MPRPSEVAVGLLLVVVLAVLLPVRAVVDEKCLSCLCQAATGCDANRDCGANTCGMFAISQQYWKDAGGPGGDFETCTLDPACATQCVRAYMRKFARDCDGDGALGCGDFARLHRLGREGCAAQDLDGEFAGRMATCNDSLPLGHFYARAVSRPARQKFGGPPSGGPSISTSVSVSNSVSVGPGQQAQQGGRQGGYQAGYQGGRQGYQSGYQGGYYGGYSQGGGGGGVGFRTSSGYQSVGGYYQEEERLGGGYRSGGGGARYGGGQQRVIAGGSGRGSSSARYPVSAACLSCICGALTGCNPNAGCSDGGCGAFRISYAYWQDAGAQGQSYEQCTRDYGCSSSSARSYLTKYAQDCNGDGAIDCRDYARIHRFGPFGCNRGLDEPYNSRVNSCAA